MNQILELRQKIGRLQDGLIAITALAAKEARAMTADENEKFEKMYADVAATRDTITNVERLEALRAENEQRSDTTERERHAAKGEKTPEERYQEAFRRYLTVPNFHDLEPEHRAVLGQYRGTNPQAVVGTTTAGGYIVPEGFRSDLVTAMKWYGGMNSVGVDVINTDMGNPLPWPTIDDTAATGAQIDENVADVVQDVAFGQTILNAYVFTSNMLKLSLEFMQDDGVNFQGRIAELLGIRLGRILNTKCTTGSGTTTPQGVVVGAAAGVTATAGQTTTVIYTNLIDLIYSINKSYRTQSKWMFSDTTEKALLKLVDGQSRPLFWNDSGSLADGRPARLLGYPYEINNDMADMAASAKAILFGDFKAYKLRMVKDVTFVRLFERYAELRQVAFMAFMRFDGRLINAGTNPIKYFANPAS